MVKSGARTRQIRTIFISDVHLGCKHSRAEALATFLEAHEPEHLFLVGDFIDGWKLKKNWRWLPAYSQIMLRLMELAQSGSRIYYTPGNHDDFLRQYLGNFGLVDIQNEFLFRTADRRQLLITHGDQFDRFERSARWLTMSLAFAYDVILSANWFAGRLRRSHSPARQYAFSSWIKQLFKRFARFVSDYERQLVAHARQNDCDGVICGHIHQPTIFDIDEITYFNTGDWVEHCTALVEYDDGAMELLFLAPNHENDLLEVVERRRAPARRKVAAALDYHNEFDDGFGYHQPASECDFEPEFVPPEVDGIAAKPPGQPPSRVRRFARRLRRRPTAAALRSIRSGAACSRTFFNPQQAWGFFIGLMRRSRRALWSSPLEQIDPGETA